MSEKTVKLYPFRFDVTDALSENSEGGAKKCEGFIADGDSLRDAPTPGYAVIDGSSLSVPTDAVNPTVFFVGGEGGGVFYSKQTEEGHEIYVKKNNSEEGFVLSGMLLDGKPIYCEINNGYMQGVAICDSFGKIYFYDGINCEQNECPTGAVAMLPFAEGFAMVTEDGIYLSPAHTPTYFSKDGDSVGLGSFRAKSACVYGNEILIAADRGIVRLVPSAYGDEPSLKKVYDGGELLYPSTLASGSIGAYVLSEKGLLSYDSGTVQYSFPLSVNSVEKGEFGFLGGGAYHAGVIVEKGDNMRKRGLISFFGDKYCLSFFDVSGVCYGVDGSIYAAVERGRKLYSFTEKPSVTDVKRVYRWHDTDFGVAGQKVLCEISVMSDRNVRATVVADGKRRVYVLKGKYGKKSVKPYFSGNVFSVEISTVGNGGAISVPTAVIEY